NYRRAQWQLAQAYLQSDDLQKCRDILEQILNDTKCSQYPLAAELMGNLYYKEKDYKKALEYYITGWEHGQHYIYKYKIAYQAANCYYYQKNKKETGLWYKKFLETNWQQQETKTHVAYAKKFVKQVRYFLY
ncbi:MAG: tetratricopeptide repeat protein, partial [Planctomycetota bacterium]